MTNKSIYCKEWRARNKDRVIAYNKQYKSSNKNKLKEMYKQWSSLNKDKIRTRLLKWREYNKEHLANYQLQKRRTPQGKMRSRVYNHRRRTRLGVLSLEIVQLVYENNIKKYGTLTCYLCELPTPFGKDALEHKIPISRGGTNDYNNLDVACKSCNSRKNTKTDLEYKELYL